MDSEEMRFAYSSGDGSVHIESTGNIRLGSLTWAGQGYARGVGALVREFHEKFGAPVAKTPRFLDEERLDLRKRLIEEEYKEFLEAVDEGDLANAFKELADLLYVVSGTAVEMGGDIDAVVAEVHHSNLTKLGPDGKPIYREDGKVLKGEGYEPPDIEGVLGL